MTFWFQLAALDFRRWRGSCRPSTPGIETIVRWHFSFAGGSTILSCVARWCARITSGRKGKLTDDHSEQAEPARLAQIRDGRRRRRGDLDPLDRCLRQWLPG